LLTCHQDPAKAEASVRLFKKDDPTFEFNTLDRIRRWRAYIASFVAVEPTEEVDGTRVHFPYLRKRLAKVEGLSEEDRLDMVRHSDKITVFISPTMYTMTFINSEPFGSGGVQYILQSDSVPRSSEESKALNDSRRELVQEKLVRNNTWMKDLSRDDVDGKKTAFKKNIEEVKKNSEDDDVEMEEV
jgi:paired amphipathic helix protein Sin3a